MDLTKIHEKLYKRINHLNHSDKHVSIFSERDSDYDVLIWRYGTHEVRARSKDYALLECIESVIQMYLEETEGES